VQWNGFVELLPLWIAPNLVTLLGFFFILGNVILLELYIPDLVGPVSCRRIANTAENETLITSTGTIMGLLQLRVWHVDVSIRHTRTHHIMLTETLQVLHHGQR
jgi:hypothetical protein